MLTLSTHSSYFTHTNYGSKYVCEHTYLHLYYIARSSCLLSNLLHCVVHLVTLAQHVQSTLGPDNSKCTRFVHGDHKIFMQTVLTGKACRSVRENSFAATGVTLFSPSITYTLPFSVRPACEGNVLQTLLIETRVQKTSHAHVLIHKFCNSRVRVYWTLLTCICIAAVAHLCPEEALRHWVQGLQQEPKLLCIVGLSGQHMCQVGRDRYEDRQDRGTEEERGEIV